MSIQKIQQLDYLILPCRDLLRAREFYLNVMKFPLLEDHPQWVRFQVGSTFLTLRPRGKWLDWHDGEIPIGSASVQLSFLMDYKDIDVCYREIVEHGVKVVSPPIDQDFGHRTLFFRDPEDNIIECYADIS